MKISIITVVWNNEKTIKNCVDSILSQSYADIEHIIIDGKSTDKTVELVKTYGDKISKFISEKDNGIYDAMNKGISMATGDVIGILNSDDFYTDEKVIEIIANEFKNKNIDATFSDLDYVSFEDEKKITRKWRSSSYFNSAFEKGWHPAHPTFFVKKEIYNKYGLFDLNFDISADFEIMLRFIEKHRIKTSYIPKVLVKMREGGESNQSIKNILLGNKNIRKAFKKNRIKLDALYTPKRLIKKAWQKIKK